MHLPNGAVRVPDVDGGSAAPRRISQTEANSIGALNPGTLVSRHLNGGPTARHPVVQLPQIRIRPDGANVGPLPRREVPKNIIDADRSWCLWSTRIIFAARI